MKAISVLSIYFNMKTNSFVTFSMFSILAIILLLPNTGKCQNSTTSSPEKKNTIKGFVTLAPLLIINEFSASVGYERKTDSTNSMELTSSFFFFMDEMGNKTRIFSLFPGYNHYFKKKRERGPVFRAGGFISFVDKIPNRRGTGVYNLGLGILGGTRIKISKNNKWHLDIALGISLNYQVKYDVYRMEDESPLQVLPRPILQFARTF